MNEDQKIKEAKNAYQREWRKKNKDKVKAANKKYWLKKALAMEQDNKF